MTFPASAGDPNEHTIAPVIRKIPALEKRILGLSGTITDTGLGAFNSANSQNLSQNLQLGISGLQIGSDFIIGNQKQDIKKIFDDNLLVD